MEKACSCLDSCVCIYFLSLWCHQLKVLCAPDYSNALNLLHIDSCNITEQFFCQLQESLCFYFVSNILCLCVFSCQVRCCYWFGLFMHGSNLSAKFHGSCWRQFVLIDSASHVRFKLYCGVAIAKCMPSVKTHFPSSVRRCFDRLSTKLCVDEPVGESSMVCISCRRFNKVENL